jgi:antirestriction protein ArdC
MPKAIMAQLTEKENPSIVACDDIVKNMPQVPIIKHAEQMAYYDSKADFINMPKRKTFKNSDLYYAVLFHELVHSTGAEKRLGRQTITDMAEVTNEKYSLEELIAEMGSAFLYSHANLSKGMLLNSAAYIEGWLRQLKNDKRFVLQASAQAQRAVDFILNIQHDQSKEQHNNADVTVEP